MRSGRSVSAGDLAHSYWRYAYSTIVGADGAIYGARRNAGSESEYIFVASAIAANTEKQRSCVCPRRHYVDTLRKCRGCEQWFIFFALEQRHWYEVLGFWIDADCVLCHACRRQDQRIRRAKNRYAERITDVVKLGSREFLTLLKDALFLTESGIIKGDAKLRRLRNIAKKRGLAGEPMSAVSVFLGETAGRSGAEC